MLNMETQTQEEVITVEKNTSQSNPLIKQEAPQKVFDKKKKIFRAYQVIWYLLGVIEIVLIFRVMLKLLGANPLSGFTNFIYSISNPFALPFAGILGITGISEMVLEWSTLIAMTVYAIVAYGIVALFQLVKPTDQEEVEQSVDN